MGTCMFNKNLNTKKKKIQDANKKQTKNCQKFVNTCFKQTKKKFITQTHKI